MILFFTLKYRLKGLRRGLCQCDLLHNHTVHEAVHVGDLEKEEFRILIYGF